MVEINTSFYRPPNAKQAEGWLKQVERRPDFLFSAKLWQKFTHERGPIEPVEARTFMDGLEPIFEQKKLAALIFQFPWSFRNTEQNLLHIERLYHTFKKYPIAIEIRHSSWNNPAFIDFIGERKIAFINIDQPNVSESLRPTVHVTAPFAYTRLHGRNTEDWFREDAGRDDRYNYLYSRNELLEWMDRIKIMAKTAGAVYIIANNHFRGQALANVIEMKNMLLGEPVMVPESMHDHFPQLVHIASNPPSQLNLFS